MSDKLIVFYSRADENYVNGQMKILETGNTEVVAGIIKEFTDADIFKIEQVNPYSKSYNECIQQARVDQNQNVRPELTDYPDNFDKYNTVYLGYPNYWNTMPMAVFTFLEHFDFSGKIIKPFCTHEGSGLGRSENDIKKLCHGAKVENGLAIHGSRLNSARPLIEKWVY